MWSLGSPRAKCLQIQHLMREPLPHRWCLFTGHGKDKQLTSALRPLLYKGTDSVHEGRAPLTLFRNTTTEENRLQQETFGERQTFKTTAVVGAGGWAGQGRTAGSGGRADVGRAPGAGGGGGDSSCCRYSCRSVELLLRRRLLLPAGPPALPGEAEPSLRFLLESPR